MHANDNLPAWQIAALVIFAVGSVFLLAIPFNMGWVGL
jgi:hypothetical protein